MKDTLEYFYSLPDNHIIFNAIREVKDLSLDWAEFGTGPGSLTERMYRCFTGQYLHTFDWFEGIPKPFFKLKKGAFACDIPEWILATADIIVHDGLFEDTIPNFVREYKSPLGLVVVDCDLYASTKTIFDNINNLVIPETIIYFDEYYDPSNKDMIYHEHRAFMEYTKHYNREFEYLYRGPSQAVLRIIG